MKLKSLLLVISLLFSLNLKSQNCFEADIILLIDFSGSEYGNEDLLIGAASEFVSELDINENKIRLGVLIFSDDFTHVANLSGNKKFLQYQIENLSKYEAGGSTNINNALIKAGNLLQNERITNKIIVIISDGEIYDIKDAFLTKTILQKSLNHSIFAVQIGGEEEGFKILISLTGSSDLIEKSSPENLIEALKKLNLCN